MLTPPDTLSAVIGTKRRQGLMSTPQAPQPRKIPDKKEQEGGGLSVEELAALVREWGRKVDEHFRWLESQNSRR
jgi:hypothetical protein